MLDWCVHVCMVIKIFMQNNCKHFQNIEILKYIHIHDEMEACLIYFNIKWIMFLFKAPPWMHLMK